MADAATTTLGRLMERNVAEVFGERDPGRRERAIAELYAEDCAFYEAEGESIGQAALSDRVGRILDEGAPGFAFSLVGPADVIEDLGRLRWELGPPRGAPVVRGMDVAIFADGKIQALYTFTETPWQLSHSERRELRRVHPAGGRVGDVFGRKRVVRRRDRALFRGLAAPGSTPAARVSGFHVEVAPEAAARAVGCAQCAPVAIGPHEHDARSISRVSKVDRRRLSVTWEAGLGQQTASSLPSLWERKFIRIGPNVNRFRRSRLALQLDNTGYTVFGTALSDDEIEGLRGDAIRREFEVNVFGGHHGDERSAPQPASGPGRILFVGTSRSRRWRPWPMCTAQSSRRGDSG